MRRTTLHARYLRSAPAGEPGQGGGGGGGGSAAPAAPAAPPAADPATPPPAAPATPPPPTPTVVPPAATPASPAPGDGLPDDAAALKAEILRLRSENASARTNAKATAAEDARKALAQEIGKTLGLVPDGEPVDPAKLTEQLTAAQSAQRDALVELAVYRAAGPLGAKPDALLDSRSFLAAIKDIDPSDGEAIKTAVEAAVTANPLLKTQPAPTPPVGVSGADFTGGTGAGNGQLTRAQLATMSPAEITQAMKEGRTDALLKGHSA